MFIMKTYWTIALTSTCGFLSCCASCSPNLRRVAETPEFAPYVLIADATADNELKQVNQAVDPLSLHVRRYGPFKLAEYRRTLTEDVGNRELHVFYELRRSVPFFGFPREFSIVVEERTNRVIAIFGE